MLAGRFRLEEYIFSQQFHVSPLITLSLQYFWMTVSSHNRQCFRWSPRVWDRLGRGAALPDPLDFQPGADVARKYALLNPHGDGPLDLRGGADPLPPGSEANGNTESVQDTLTRHYPTRILLLATIRPGYSYSPLSDQDSLTRHYPIRILLLATIRPERKLWPVPERKHDSDSDGAWLN